LKERAFVFAGAKCMAEIELTPFHDWLVELRRHFHQFPELAYREKKTAAKIVAVLQELDVPLRNEIGKTGVVATLSAQRPGPSVAMRADMDALPLEEQNDVPYRSKHPGVMHACGHDAHVAIMLGVVRALVETDWARKGAGKIHFIFQPAEEGGAGARAMLETGILDAEPIEAIFAGHMYPELSVGHIGFASEVSNAASDNINIRIVGRGGHGAQPQACIDPIVAGAYLVTQLQSIISRSIAPLDSAVLTIGSFHAGTARNIIPQEANLAGTLRTLKPEVRERVLARLRELLKGLDAAHQVTAELQTSVGYPLLVNETRLVHFVETQANTFLGEVCVHRGVPRMGSEDFAFFLQKFPGILIRVGCSDPERSATHGLHSPCFDLDERVLDVGVRLFVHLLTSYAFA
jgi:amidohydrolase